MLLQHYGLPVVVALTPLGSDTERELAMIRKRLGEQGVEALACEHFAKGSKAATNLANSMVRLIDERLGSLTFVYDDADELWKKIGEFAKKNHASEVVADTAVRKKIEKRKVLVFCIAENGKELTTNVP